MYCTHPISSNQESSVDVDDVRHAAMLPNALAFASGNMQFSDNKAGTPTKVSMTVGSTGKSTASDLSSDPTLDLAGPGNKRKVDDLLSNCTIHFDSMSKDLKKVADSLVTVEKALVDAIELHNQKPDATDVSINKLVDGATHRLGVVRAWLTVNLQGGKYHPPKRQD